MTTEAASEGPGSEGPTSKAISMPSDLNKAWGSAAGGIGTGALVGTVVWQVVAQIWPGFTPTPEYVLLTTTVISAIGSWLGAYLIKHNVPI